MDWWTLMDTLMEDPSLFIRVQKQVITKKTFRREEQLTLMDLTLLIWAQKRPPTSTFRQD
eukprot:scaffold421861_cov110-Attheya_sp.AAC.1